MAKTKEEKVEEVKEEVKSIAKLEIEFGREDLNLLRDKINEIIEKRG